MPLSERARVEVYVRDLPTPAYAAIRFDSNLAALSRFTDKLRQAAFDALHDTDDLGAAGFRRHEIDDRDGTVRGLLSIGFEEVEPDGSSPRTVYDGIYDFVWFTPRAAREDPCRNFRLH